jgi:hypothetical protein
MQLNCQLPQNLRVRFDFRKAKWTRKQNMGSPSARHTYDGAVQVTITINNVKYGPHGTSIRTFRSVWDGRKAQRLSNESKALINELSTYEALIEAIYRDLMSRDEIADGEAIMQIIKRGGSLHGATLPDVYTEFLTARKAMIQPDQRLRQPDQISIATFATYAKRWDMIQLYLVTSGRTNVPVTAINYGFVTRFKEYLVAYRSPRYDAYSSATINKCISLLKQLITYAQSKNYVRANTIANFACRGGSAAKPKPLSEANLTLLETVQLSRKLRHVCDSWLIAGELCLHYADYMKLPTMKFVNYQGRVYIQHERSKQQGTSLVQTVNVTARAARLIEKWGGTEKLYYMTSGAFSSALKQIALFAGLKDDDGNYISLQFGQGRDTGLTNRAKKGANAIQLSNMAGWSNPREARRYIGDGLGVVAGFVDRSEEAPASEPPRPHQAQPFLRIHRPDPPKYDAL